MADGVFLDSNNYAFLLKRCIATKALARGKQIHAHIIKTGLQGHASEALKHFCQMQRGGSMPKVSTFGNVLIASVGIAAAEEGKPIHAHVFKDGLEREVLAGSALVDIYAKFQNMADAQQVFDKMRKRDEVSWGAMICGYAQNGCSEEAVRIFYDMKGVWLSPDVRDLVQWIRDEGGFVDEGLKLESEGSSGSGLMSSKVISAGTKTKSLPCHIPLALPPLVAGPNQTDAILLRLAEVLPRIATTPFSMENICSGKQQSDHSALFQIQIMLLYSKALLQWVSS